MSDAEKSDFVTIDQYTRSASVRRKKTIAKLACLAAATGQPVVVPGVPRDELVAMYNVLLQRVVSGYYEHGDIPLDPSHVHESIRKGVSTLAAAGRVTLKNCRGFYLHHGKSQCSSGGWFVPDGVTLSATDADVVLKATEQQSAGDDNEHK